MNETPTIRTWHRNAADEDHMGPGHESMWRHFIRSLPEDDLSASAVLDFGCNQGGFLRLLHELKPFRHGLGLDIAVDSVAVANANKGGLPVDYEIVGDLTPYAGRFDLATSYEVVYLLPDLAAHAAQMMTLLRSGGVYYAVTGCHAGNPLWPRWREMIAEISAIPVPDHTPEAIVGAFRDAGFTASAKHFRYDGFVKLSDFGGQYDTVAQALDQPDRIALMFRFEKPGTKE